MAIITFKGTPIHTCGTLPGVGDRAPDFLLVTGSLGESALSSFAGKKLVLNIVPSLDTGICQLSAKAFNAQVGQLPGVVVANVSLDLPFAQKRFCESEKLDHIVNLSGFRSPAFGADYGVTINEGPLAGLYSRAVVVVDGQGTILHSQQVPEIVQEPDYGAVLKVLHA